MNSIEQVFFYGDTLQAIRSEGGWVVLRTMCEALGLSAHGQAERLSRQPWATTRVMRAVGADGRARDMLCLDVETVGTWLVTIDASRMKDASLRSKVVRYQCEAKRVLANHFFPPVVTIAHPAMSDPVVAHGVRMGDNPETRDDMQRYCALAAKATGWTVRLVHGLIRRRHRISSPYYLGVLFWPSMRDELHEIALGKVVRALPAKLRLVKPANPRQLPIFPHTTA